MRERTWGPEVETAPLRGVASEPDTQLNAAPAHDTADCAPAGTSAAELHSESEHAASAADAQSERARSDTPEATGGMRTLHIGAPAMRVVYLAHPLGDGTDRALNRANAARWVAWATLVHQVAVVADWITLSGELSEEHRELGLRCDLALIERCDEIWLCGGRVSPGMAKELAHAQQLGKRVVDLTFMGFVAPEWFAHG